MRDKQPDRDNRPLLQAQIVPRGTVRIFSEYSPEYSVVADSFQRIADTLQAENSRLERFKR